MLIGISKLRIVPCIPRPQGLVKGMGNIQGFIEVCSGIIRCLISMNTGTGWEGEKDYAYRG